MNNILVLKKYAFSYLSKYNTSKKNLDRILQNKVRRMNLNKKDKYALYSSIASILTDLENNKLIDDNNFAQSKIHSLSLQGKSRIFIKNYLFNTTTNPNKLFDSAVRGRITPMDEDAEVFLRCRIICDQVQI